MAGHKRLSRLPRDDPIKKLRSEFSQIGVFFYAHRGALESDLRRLCSFLVVTYVIPAKNALNRFRRFYIYVIWCILPLVAHN